MFISRVNFIYYNPYIMRHATAFQALSATTTTTITQLLITSFQSTRAGGTRI